MISVIAHVQESSPAKNETEWVADCGSETGCLVIFEGDPAPASSSGRTSFSGLVTDNEKIEVQVLVHMILSPFIAFLMELRTRTL